jgi:hypothetical protein
MIAIKQSKAALKPARDDPNLGGKTIRYMEL